MNYPYKENWWETKDHKKIKISDMETSHIENTIRYLQRHSDFYDELIGDNWFGYDYKDNSYLVVRKIEELQYELKKRRNNMKFKVGDKVKGISNEYNITNKDMYLGEIKEVDEDSILILVLKHKNSMLIGTTYYAFNPEGKFEIVDNLTISQLQSEIDKLSDKVQKEYSNVISNRDKVNYLKKQLKQLKEENKKEKNKPILDDEEKEYLKNVIKTFRNRVNYISKETTCTCSHYIYIDLVDDYILLPIFSNKTMYKGMKANKEYTLKELGL